MKVKIKMFRKIDKAFVFPVAIAGLMIFAYLFREEYPFNLIVRSQNPSSLEWIGMLMMWFFIPTLVYIVFMPQAEYKKCFSEKTGALSCFAGFSIIFWFYGFLISALFSLVWLFISYILN